MARRVAQTNKIPVKIVLADGSIFACPCKSKEFRLVSDPVLYFCRCGQVYTVGDLPPLAGA